MFDMLCAKSADSVDAAKLNERDGSFKTPLAICAAVGNQHLAAALLRHGGERGVEGLDAELDLRRIRRHRRAVVHRRRRPPPPCGGE